MEFEVMICRVTPCHVIGEVGALIVLNIKRWAYAEVVCYLIKRIEVKGQNAKVSINIVQQPLIVDTIFDPCTAENQVQRSPFEERLLRKLVVVRSGGRLDYATAKCTGCGQAESI